MPWLLLASQYVVDCPRSAKWSVVGVGIAYGCLILSHLPTLLVVSLLWVWFPFATLNWRDGRAVAIRLYGGALLGGGWTAAYLLPVLHDRHWTQVTLLNALEEYRPQHRLVLDGVLSLQPQFADHWFDKVLIYPWLASALWVGAALFIWGAIRWPTIAIAPNRLQVAAGYWLLASTLALLMTTDVLGWVYGVFPPLQRIQFSWRWMTVLCTTVPMLLGYLLYIAGRAVRFAQRSRSLMLWAVLLLAIVANLHQLGDILSGSNFAPETISQFNELVSRKQFPAEPTQWPRQSFIYGHWVHPDGLGLVDVPEYRHRSAVLGMPPERAYPLLEWREGGSQGFSSQHWEYGRRQFTANNSTPEPRSVLLRTFFYPGWLTWLDGRRIPTDRNEVGQNSSHRSPRHPHSYLAIQRHSSPSNGPVGIRYHHGNGGAMVEGNASDMVTGFATPATSNVYDTMKIPRKQVPSKLE